VVGLTDAQLIEEDAVELVVVVLPGVDEHVVDGLVETGHHPGEPDDLRSRPDDGHHLGHGVWSSLFS
jgi:hypothetical protein